MCLHGDNKGEPLLELNARAEALHRPQGWRKLAALSATTTDGTASLTAGEVKLWVQMLPLLLRAWIRENLIKTNRADDFCDRLGANWIQEVLTSVVMYARRY